MEFLNPEAFWALLALLPLSYFLMRRSSSLESLFAPEIFAKMSFSRQSLSRRSRNVLMLLAMSFVIIALARPVLKEGEITRDSTYQDSWYVAADGKRRKILTYNLDAIITVGYRVKSRRGTEFRRWATRQLRERLLLRVAPANVNAAAFAEMERKLLNLQCEVALLSAGHISQAQHKRLKADVAVLAELEAA